MAYLLNVVVAESTAILKLLAGKDQTLLVWWNALLVLDLALNIVDGVARLHLEGDSLAREGFDEAVQSRISLCKGYGLSGFRGRTSAL
jgi:hypothetical protein